MHLENQTIDVYDEEILLQFLICFYFFVNLGKSFKRKAFSFSPEPKNGRAYLSRQVSFARRVSPQIALARKAKKLLSYRNLININSVTIK